MEKNHRKNLRISIAVLILLPLLVFQVFRGSYREIWDNIRAIPAAGLLLLLGLDDGEARG